MPWWVFLFLFFLNLYQLEMNTDVVVGEKTRCLSFTPKCSRKKSILGIGETRVTECFTRGKRRST